VEIENPSRSSARILALLVAAGAVAAAALTVRPMFARDELDCAAERCTATSAGLLQSTSARSFEARDVVDVRAMAARCWGTSTTTPQAARIELKTGDPVVAGCVAAGEDRGRLEDLRRYFQRPDGELHVHDPPGGGRWIPFAGLWGLVAGGAIAFARKRGRRREPTRGGENR
jgi:hypothetical protein